MSKIKIIISYCFNKSSQLLLEQMHYYCIVTCNAQIKNFPTIKNKSFIYFSIYSNAVLPSLIFNKLHDTIFTQAEKI
jgi:hypothetical protein